jgi:hypothetical protein
MNQHWEDSEAVEMTTFFIPDCSEKSNKITQKDITNGRLRITAKNKKYFPNEECDVVIIVADKEYICKFKLNSDDKERSYIILLPKELSASLQLKTTDVLECQKIDEKKYHFSK